MHDCVMRAFSLLLTYATLCAFVGCAMQPVDGGPAATAPMYRVGDRWVYQASDGFRDPTTWVETHEVLSINAERITVRITQRGDRTDNVRTEVWAAPGLVTSGSVYDNETRQFAQPLQRYNFPMAPGRIWNQWVVNLNDTTHREGAINRYVVVGDWQKITTPAGTFDAIQLNVIMRLDDDEFWRGPTTCDDRVWYAPAVRTFVRAHRDAGYVERGGPDSAPVWTQHAVIELRTFTPGA
jgi:hypothetical protein